MDDDFKTISSKNFAGMPSSRRASVGDDDVTVADSSSWSRRFVVGDVLLGRYRILSELGQGGMGVVYKCFDQTAGIEVALKALPSELSHNSAEMEDVRENFQLVSRLIHQNIAVSKTLEKDSVTGDYYLVMECVEGEDLKHWLKKHKTPGGGVPLEEALPILRQVAEALDYAHGERIIHRDIKPSNIMVSAEGKVKVLDFGLAAQIHTSLSRVSMAYHGTSGTSAYMSPEQWEGRAQDAHTDQYALGVMVYEMLTGRVPFENSDIAVLQQIVLTQEPEEIKGVPQTAMCCIRKAMNKKPKERYATCLGFIEDLRIKCGASASSPIGKIVKKILFVLVLISILALTFCVVNRYVKFNFCNNGDATCQEIDESILTMEKEKLSQLIQREKEKNYNLTQGVGTHYNKLLHAYELGSQALREGKKEKAQEYFENARKELAWLNENVPVRDSIQKNLQKIIDLRLKTLENVPELYLSEKWSLLMEKENELQTAFEEGDFKKAQGLFLELQVAYSELTSNSKPIDEGNTQGGFVATDQGNQIPALEMGRDYSDEIRSTAFHYGEREAEEQNEKVGGTLGEKVFSREKNGGEKKTPEQNQIMVTKQDSSQNDVEICRDEKNIFNGIVILPGKVKLEMIHVKAGTFQMGSPKGENGRFPNEILHQVTLTNDYWLGRFEVTQKQWNAIMRENPSEYQGDNRPVEQVTWEDAQSFCQILNVLLEKELPEGYVFSLPTEAQWEYACRAGSSELYGGRMLKDVAWYDGNSGGKTHDVGQKTPNAWGFYDMLGNVHEYCLDWYEGYRQSPQTDPVGNNYRSHRVYRGGGKGSWDMWCRPACRHDHVPIFHYCLGFRLALVKDQVLNTVSAQQQIKSKAKDSSAIQKFNGVVVLPDNVKIEMIQVKAGTFQMGSSSSEAGHDGDEVLHEVTLTKDYWLGKYEVTQSQWQAVMGTNPSMFVGDNLPVESVSWNDVQIFCQRLNTFYRGNLPEGYAFSLPTEAQWEYACRAGTSTAYSFGNDYRESYANCGDHRRSLNGVSVNRRTCEVGSYSPNAWGFYDMHGNVWEWCQDLYGDYQGTQLIDPMGPEVGVSRVDRGGGWDNFNPWDSRSANRDNGRADNRGPRLGFRLALSYNPGVSGN